MYKEKKNGKNDAVAGQEFRILTITQEGCGWIRGCGEFNKFKSPIWSSRFEKKNRKMHF